MITIDAGGLEDLALVIGTAFPVLAVAYYSAARGMLDDKLRDEGPDWSVDLIAPGWTQKNPARFLVRKFGNIRSRDGGHGYFSLDEKFKLSTDRSFMLAMPIGLILTLAYLLFSWRWALAASLVVLQFTIGTLIMFGTQVSMIKLASAIANPPAQKSGQQPPQEQQPPPTSGTSSLDTRPMSALIRAWVMQYLLSGLAAAAAVIIVLAKVRGT
jgi:hypothetical protein